MTDTSRLPPHMREGVIAYIQHGVEPGRFLRAVFENDLVRAFGQADGLNRNAMFEWANFLYNEAPPPCWGSPEKVAAWIEKRGMTEAA